MGLERTGFMTASQKFVAEFLSGAALVPVTAAVSMAINRISGGAPGPKNMQEFMDGVASNVVQGGIIQLFVAFLTHKLPPPAGRPKGPATSAEKTQPPTTTKEPPSAPGTPKTGAAELIAPTKRATTPKGGGPVEPPGGAVERAGTVASPDPS